MKTHHKVEFNMFNLVKRLETMNRRRYTYTEISEAAGLHFNTVTRLVDGKTQHVHVETIGKILDYFESQGMPIELSDLLIVTQEETSG